MARLDPMTFFLWEKPRLLLDIRPENAFVKGAFKNAVSMPVSGLSSIEKLIKLIHDSENDVHLIDLDGKTSEQVSETIPVHYLEGGYKSFKAFREQAFNSGPPLRVLGGYTGSGKTKLLLRMQESGFQIIDLELLASHKGSVFGAPVDTPQSPHETFQNNLLAIWLSLDTGREVWLEEKGPFLGRAGLPKMLYEKMLLSPLIHLDVPFDERLGHIFDAYGNLEPAMFKQALRSLEARMGTSNNHKALHYYNSGQKEKCFELLLRYYDKAYDKRRQAQWKGEIINLPHSLASEEDSLKKLEHLK